jgi:hypothetical protein
MQSARVHADIICHEGRGPMNRKNVIPIFGIDSFSYTLLAGNPHESSRGLELHNRAFLYWKKFWTDVFKEISGERVQPDDFFRQSLVCVLSLGDEIVALHLYTFFSLESSAALEHSYFKSNYKPESITRMRAAGIRTVMSMEYLTLNENFRHARTGLPLASVVIGLGYQVMSESGVDAMIAPCRRDLKVDRKAAEFGAEPISEEFIHHAVPVILMMTARQRLKLHPDPAVNAGVELLWKKKMDLVAADSWSRPGTDRKIA